MNRKTILKRIKYNHIMAIYLFYSYNIPNYNYLFMHEKILYKLAKFINSIISVILWQSLFYLHNIIYNQFNSLTFTLSMIGTYHYLLLFIFAV